MVRLIWLLLFSVSKILVVVVPLLVSLFTDATKRTTKEMVSSTSQTPRKVALTCLRIQARSVQRTR